MGGQPICFGEEMQKLPIPHLAEVKHKIRDICLVFYHCFLFAYSRYQRYREIKFSSSSRQRSIALILKSIAVLVFTSADGHHDIVSAIGIIDIDDNNELWKLNII